MINAQLKLQRKKSNTGTANEGIKGYYKKKGMDTNFAAGFVDLNPKYSEMRHQRAVKLAKKWEDNIGSKLLE